ncbi:MAG: sulfite dehydrogenase [Alphaproteobacteria bacterium BRH_c36]|nr:MAG: sulfite dehydrogenase [Alphaproteobacteria bacterium BRH_c36]
MRSSIAAGGALVAGSSIARAQSDTAITQVQDWARRLGKGVDATAYGQPSPYEKDVVRRHVEWLTPSVQTSVNFTPLHELDGIITPNGLCFERHHAGVAEVEPDKYRLMINGLVDKSLVFTLDDLKRFPRRNQINFLECAANTGMEWRGVQLNGCQFTHGMVHNVMYTGVPLSVLFEEAGLKTSARWVMAEGADASAMNRSLPMAKAIDDCMIAFKMNGEALRPEQGYPARLVVPGWEGSMWVKWIRRLEIGDEPWHSREETSKYTDLLTTGKSRRFTWEMDCKSVITSPSPQAPVNHKRGQTVITGLAWSGRGTIARVDVSLDGGRNWVAARIDGPSLNKSLHRFYYDFDWNGEAMLLQSRAVDSTGYIQPTKAELRQVRGTNSVYHNNSIQTWYLKKSGEVENVEIS